MSAEPRRLHFIAIGGAGMSVVAELAIARGIEVTGSDAKDSAALRRLEGLGAQVHVGHAARHVDGADAVVVSTAVRAENVELARAHQLGVPVLHRSQALVEVAGDQDFVAVAGAHGKTTTTAMLTMALRAAGLDPSIAVGGTVPALGSGGLLGAGRVFVAEADESDGSFLNYAPRIAIVTNIDLDHVATWASIEALEEAFREFAAHIVPGGLLVACADDARSLALARHANAAGVRVRTYGASADPGIGDHVLVHDVELSGDGSRAALTLGAISVEVRLGALGLHNVLDAAAAWAAGMDLGASAQDLARGLAEFTGTGRRFEERGEVRGVRVVDDYAHHPAEIDALLSAARLAAGRGRVLALFQPHLFSRTQALAADFAAALDAADLVVVTDIKGVREDPIEGVSSALITAAVPAARAGRPGAEPFALVPDRLAAAEAVAAAARPGDLVLTIGADDVTELGPVILNRLGARA